MKTTLVTILAILAFMAIDNDFGEKGRGCPVIIECGTQHCKVKCHRFNPDLQTETEKPSLK
jgi:hypothetical protein